MPMEQEVMGLLIGGLSLFIGISLVATVFLWMKNKTHSKAYIWTVLHFLVFSLAAYFLLKAMNFDYNHPMASELISLQLGFAGVTWSISIICLLIGIKYFSANK